MATINLFRDMQKALMGEQKKVKVEPFKTPASMTKEQSAAFITSKWLDAWKEKQAKETGRQDSASANKILQDYIAPQTPFSTEKYGTSPEDLMVAAKGYDGSYDDGDEQILSSDDQREFYTQEANKVENAYNAGDPAGAALVRQQAAAGAYNMPDQRGFLNKFFGAEEKKEMGPETKATMMQVLLGDKSKRDAAAAAKLARTQEMETFGDKERIKAKYREPKPVSNPTRYKEWKLSGSKLTFEKYMEKDDLSKLGLRPEGSGEPPTAIQGGPADIRQQRLKLQESSNALMAKRVTLMQQKIDPEYIKKIEGIRKSAGYVIDLRKSMPKARGAVNTLKIKGEKVASIVAEALPLAQSMFAAGPGSMLSSVWNTDSRKLAGLLTNLKAVIGFDTLAEMRANSPTGGALGQVSNIEINLLQAVQGTLDQGQQELLIRSLTDIKGNYPRLLAWAEERFKEQYSPLNPPSTAVPPPPEGYN